MSTLKRHRAAILVGLLAVVGVWWWRRRQAASAPADTSPNTAVPYYVSSPVPASGGFTGSDWTASTAPSGAGLGTTGGGTTSGTASPGGGANDGPPNSGPFGPPVRRSGGLVAQPG